MCKTIVNRNWLWKQHCQGWDEGHGIRDHTHGFTITIIPIQKLQIILRFQDLCAKIVGIRDQNFDVHKFIIHALKKIALVMTLYRESLRSLSHRTSFIHVITFKYLYIIYGFFYTVTSTINTIFPRLWIITCNSFLKVFFWDSGFAH